MPVGFIFLLWELVLVFNGSWMFCVCYVCSYWVLFCFVHVVVAFAIDVSPALVG